MDGRVDGGDDGIVAGQEAGGQRHALSGLRLREPHRRRHLRQLRRGPRRPRHAAAGARLPRPAARASISTSSGAPPPLIVAAGHAARRRSIARMHEADTDCVLVMADDRLVGIFTDRDAVREGGRQARSTSFHVRDFMTPDPVVLRHDDPIAVAIHKMAVGGFRHIPIVEDGRPTGVVTARDVFHHLARRSTDAVVGRRIAILAQDLIWPDRLARAVEAAGAEPVPRQDRARARRALDRRGLRDRRPDRPGLRPARRDRAARSRPAPGSSPSGSTTTSTCASGPWRAGRTGCSPIASCSRTGPRRSRPGSRDVGRGGGVTVAARPVVPAARYAERLARAAAAAAAAGLDALLIGVGSDLRYLTGYEAMPLERLTMLVVRPGGAPFARRATPGARRRRGRAADPARDRDLGRDRRSRTRSAARRPGGRRGRSPCRTRCWRCTCCASRRRLGLRAFGARLASTRPARTADDQGRRRGRPAAARGPGRRPRGRPDRGGPAGRADRGRRRPRGPRAAHRRGPRRGPLRDRRLRARTPRRRTTRPPSGSSRPASRSCSTSAARSAATARTSRGRCGSPAATRPRARTSGSATCSTSCTRPGGRHARRPPGRRLRGGRCRRARADRGRGLRRGVLPPNRARDRPRGPRGAVSRRRQRPAAAARDGVQRGAGHLPAGEYGARIEDIVVCGEDGPIVLNEAPRELYVVDG